MKTHRLPTFVLAASLCLAVQPSLSQGADDSRRCDHRFEEMKTLFQRADASETALHQRMDRIAGRLDALMESEQPVCFEGQHEGCIGRDAGLSVNHNESTGLDSAYAAFRAQRRQYNEYVTFFDTTCVKAGYGAWGTAEGLPLWSEQTAADEIVGVLREMLASEREWLQVDN
jgi:hypothetical protein